MSSYHSVIPAEAGIQRAAPAPTNHKGFLIGAIALDPRAKLSFAVSTHEDDKIR